MQSLAAIVCIAQIINVRTQIVKTFLHNLAQRQDCQYGHGVDAGREVRR